LQNISVTSSLKRIRMTRLSFIPFCICSSKLKKCFFEKGLVLYSLNSAKWSTTYGRYYWLSSDGTCLTMQKLKKFSLCLSLMSPLNKLGNTEKVKTHVLFKELSHACKLMFSNYLNTNLSCARDRTAIKLLLKDKYCFKFSTCQRYCSTREISFRFICWCVTRIWLSEETCSGLRSRSSWEDISARSSTRFTTSFTDPLTRVTWLSFLMSLLFSFCGQYFRTTASSCWEHSNNHYQLTRLSSLT